MKTNPFTVVSDGLRLPGGICMPQKPRGLLVFLHGIPSSAPPDPGDLGYAGLAGDFAVRGWAGAWADLRGKRGSEGFFSIEGWVRDARALTETARASEGLDSKATVLVGSSAGGAVATELVARWGEVEALVLLAAPAEWLGFADDPIEGVRRIQEDAGMLIPPEAFADPAPWADEFLSVTTLSSIGSLSIPILIVHGTADSVVPVDHARLLAEAAPGARLQIIEGAEHQLRRHPRIVELVADWLDEVLK